MAKLPNHIGTVKITLSTTQPVQECLERLLLSGFYGKNPADAAERLLARTLEQMVNKGELPNATS